MRFDSDVALLGTGAAPLVAARHLLEEGRSVLILNPDRDFFLEDSEMPLDPCLPAHNEGRVRAERLARSLPERALEELRPSYPGALEYRSGTSSDEGAGARFHDLTAPHLRARSRLFAAFGESFSRLEDFYVEASDAGLNPQLLEGIQAGRRFPGVSSASEAVRGVLVPRICDVDVIPYRNGILEFLRERLGRERVACSASQIELMEGGIRFHADGASHTARIKDGILVFWTPRMTSWILGQAKRAEVEPKAPLGVRYWEEWSLVSRAPIDPSIVGVSDDVAVWAEVEGPLPEPGLQRRATDRASDLAELPEYHLNVLRGGELLPLTSYSSEGWASAASFEALGELTQGALKWERFSIRGLKPRAILHWKQGARDWLLAKGSADQPRVRVVVGCDGPLLRVVHSARRAVRELLEPEK